MAWLSRARKPRRTPGAADARVPGQGLDRITPPTYDMSPGRQEQARAEIAELVGRLQPGALDAGSREVLNNLINARTDAELAELDAARDERKAVVDNLVALAAEQVARYKPSYDADLARVGQTGSVLAATYEALTGRTPTEFVPPRPRRAGDGPIESTLGPIDLSDDALPVRPDGFPNAQDKGFR
jgi:hypothetical protein